MPLPEAWVVISIETQVNHVLDKWVVNFYKPLQ